MVEGYLIDAKPIRGGLILYLNNFKKAFVKTTFPVYLITENPEMVMQHPAVVSYEEEEWNYQGKKRKVYRFEVDDISAYYYIRNKLNVVNETPSVLSQTLYRLGILPFRWVSIEGNEIKTRDDDFPKISYATLIPLDWYGEGETGSKIKIIENGEERVEQNPKVKVDVAECLGIACNNVEAVVKIDIKRKRSPVSIKGLIEWSYDSKVLLREIAYATIGKALTTNEAWVALKRKYIIPKVVPRVEKMRTIEELEKADRGGLVIFPKVGCFNNVYQIDFSSMYPSLIVKYNISAETVDACEDLNTEIGHSICFKEKGIVPEALEWLIKRKEELKKIDEERAEAIKWMLVASFGYLGFRNSKFGKIEAYELVTYFARKTLRQAIELAEEMGLEVLHGVIDSLSVRGNVKDYVKKLEEITGLKVKVEEFKWMIFTKNKEGFPYPTRYFGKGEEMKVRGLIRSNMPNVVKYFLEEVLSSLSKANSCEEINVKEIDEIYKKYRERIVRGEPKDYVIWIDGIPYVRGIKGFYEAYNGFRGVDVFYYLNYLKRTYEEFKGFL